jgi:hypothetical protein
VVTRSLLLLVLFCYSFTLVFAVRTESLSLIVKSPADTAEKIIQIAKGAGGFLVTSNVNGGADADFFVRGIIHLPIIGAAETFHWVYGAHSAVRTLKLC